MAKKLRDFATIGPPVTITGGPKLLAYYAEVFRGPLMLWAGGRSGFDRHTSTFRHIYTMACGQMSQEEAWAWTEKCFGLYKRSGNLDHKSVVDLAHELLRLRSITACQQAPRLKINEIVFDELATLKPGQLTRPKAKFSKRIKPTL